MTELPDLLETFHISIGDVGAIRLELPEFGMKEMIQAADYTRERFRKEEGKREGLWTD